MCVIIDINVLGSVFRRESENHDDFEPIYRWISEGFGRIVYGGTKYKRELSKSRKYSRIFKHFNNARRVIKIPDEDVETIEKKISKELEEIIKPKISKHIFDERFNDPHIVSIAVVSKCKIVCTDDGGLSDFLKMSQFYPEGIALPKIYRNKSNRNLLNNNNIAEICKPCVKLRKVKSLP